MTRIERYEAQLDELRRKRGTLLKQGNFVKAMKLGEDIKEIERMIDDLKEQTRPRPLSQIMTPEQLEASGIVELITEAHIAADYMAYVYYRLMDTCNDFRIAMDSVTEPLKQAIALNNEFVSDLMGKNAWLESVLLGNEILLAALHKKVASFISQRKPKDIYEKAE